jgi:hypothetical protein
MIILSIVPIACLIVAICKYRKGLVGGELIAAWTWAASAQIFLGILMIQVEKYIIQVNGLIETVYRLLEKIQ